MSNNELIKAIGDLLDLKLAVFSGSAQGSTGSDAAVGAARTKSNKETDSGTETVFKTVEQVADINAPEAWAANVKRTYDLHQTADFDERGRNRQHFDAIVSQQIKHVANLDSMNLQAVANNQNQSNLNNTLGIDRAWNINETDAFAVLLNKVVSDAVKAALDKGE